MEIPKIMEFLNREIFKEDFEQGLLEIKNIVKSKYWTKVTVDIIIKNERLSDEN